MKDLVKEEVGPPSQEQGGRDGGFLTHAVVGHAPATVRDANATGATAGVAGAAAAVVSAASAAGSAMLTAATGVPRSFAPGAFGAVSDDRVLAGSVGWEGTATGTTGLGGEPPNRGEVPVNVFWSPERKAYERLHFGERVEPQGGNRSVSDTPQGGHQGGVEMDPIELFRIRCFREAEEKCLQEAEERFKAGLLKMSQEVSSAGSFMSAAEDQGGRSGTPAPPPGPPPMSPEREGRDKMDGQPTPPPPPLPPVPPMPVWNSEDGSRSRNFGERILGKSDSPRGENPTESLRTFDLPLLDEEASSLEFGDWL